MNKILIIIFLWIVYTSCANQGKDVSAFVLVEDEFNTEIMDSKIISAIDETIKSQRFSSDSVVYCITVEFWNGYARGITPEDTLVVISYYSSQIPDEGYKGTLVVNSYPIAVLDKNDIGHNYYDKNALLNYPLKNFKSIEIPAFFNGQRYIKLSRTFFICHDGDLDEATYP